MGVSRLQAEVAEQLTASNPRATRERPAAAKATRNRRTSRPVRCLVPSLWGRQCDGATKR
jgi:hypothetical protein